MKRDAGSKGAYTCKLKNIELKRSPESFPKELNFPGGRKTVAQAKQATQPVRLTSIVVFCVNCEVTSFHRKTKSSLFTEGEPPTTRPFSHSIRGFYNFVNQYFLQVAPYWGKPLTSWLVCIWFFLTFNYNLPEHRQDLILLVLSSSRKVHSTNTLVADLCFQGQREGSSNESF